LNVVGSSNRTLGKNNLADAAAIVKVEAVNPAQASVIHDKNDRRGISPFPRTLTGGSTERTSLIGGSLVI
jgi:hypothetical protein